MSKLTPVEAAAQNRAIEVSVTKKEQARRELVKKFMAEPLITVTVSPFYAKYLGKTVMISIQGISVYVPANGRPYKVPAKHAAELFASIEAIDIREMKVERMSQVQNNIETSVGGLHF
jgi:hypothetical protein